MAKWSFLFCVLLASGCVTMRRPLVVPFGQKGERSDTLAFHDTVDVSLGDWGGDQAIRFFNKNLHAVYHGDTMVHGEAIVWFVIDREGKCVDSYYDAAASQPEVALEVLRVINKMDIYQPVTPSRISGKPMVSRIRMRVVFQFAAGPDDPPPPPGPKPDILLIGFPPQY